METARIRFVAAIRDKPMARDLPARADPANEDDLEDDLAGRRSDGGVRGRRVGRSRIGRDGVRGGGGFARRDPALDAAALGAAIRSGLHPRGGRFGDAETPTLNDGDMILLDRTHAEPGTDGSSYSTPTTVWR